MQTLSVIVMNIGAEPAELAAPAGIA